MSTMPTVVLPPIQERTLLYTLAGVQFTHVMDFMIMMPLGARLMPDLGINPTQFSWLVAAYGMAAAATGLIGGFLLDRFDRKRALLGLYFGFGAATLSCALAGDFWTLLISRVAAGGCGGVAGSIVTAMVGDVIPPERRGRAMGTVMTAFPLASVFGVPLGLTLSNLFSWHAPFYLLASASGIVLVMAWRILPVVETPRETERPIQQMVSLLSIPAHRRGLALGGMLVFGGASVIPFMAPTMEINVGVPASQIPWIYALGGVCTFFTMPFMGWLADRHDKLHVLGWITILASISVLVLTHLPPVPLPTALLASTLFFIGMSGRFPPAMAMVTNAVDARYRGGFMSLNSACQQAFSAVANIVAGLLITTDTAGQLRGYPTAGFVALGAFAATLWLAARLKSIAPHAVRTATAANLPIDIDPQARFPRVR